MQIKERATDLRNKIPLFVLSLLLAATVAAAPNMVFAQNATQTQNATETTQGIRIYTLHCLFDRNSMIVLMTVPTPVNTLVMFLPSTK
jgi:uncharacterized membrane protein